MEKGGRKGGGHGWCPPRAPHREETLPESWEHVLMILIPKIAQPSVAKHVGPLCFAGAVSKLYCRMLLGRTGDALKFSGPAQTLGEGRQTVDYLWVINQMMALEQEWRKGLCWIKIDLVKAFDRLDRAQFLRKLRTQLGRNEVLWSWWEMFRRPQALFTTAWGQSIVKMKSGIRQGAVESPPMFSTAIDWILEEVATEMSWDPKADVYAGLAQVACVDDMIMWNGSKEGLAGKVAAVTEGLQDWGLRVNLQKCLVYVSPYSKESGSLEVANTSMKPAGNVNGVQGGVGIRLEEALAPLVTKTKGRFWAMKHLVRPKTPLPGRLKLMHKVLGNMMLWNAAAFYPDQA